MTNSQDFVTQMMRWCVIIGISLLVSPMGGMASDLFQNFEFDQCDPVEYRAPIMEVHPERGQLIVAEESIYVVNRVLDNVEFKTSVIDAYGNPLSVQDLEVGQYVLVLGFKSPDGGVVASLIQQNPADRQSQNSGPPVAARRGASKQRVK
jgi:hypothetical protein